MTDRTPKVFLSFAFEDQQLAGRIARTLQANGIDTWWAEWCIGAGDSIRQLIDQGLGNCTHFVVLLTPTSVAKPWVAAEMDAGLVAKLSKGTKFIVLRSNLAPSAMPPLLQALLSPEVDPASLDLTQLVNDIHGVTRKPPLGLPPLAARALPTSAPGFSNAANALARLFVERSKNATQLDPNFSAKELASELSLSEGDVRDAVFELQGLVENHRNQVVHAKDELFVVFDKYWMGWDAEEDALRLATALVNDSTFPRDPAQQAQALGWPARRLNPATAYLANRDLIKSLRSSSGDAWRFATMHNTDATRRFVKSRS
jgi:TIR domain